MKRWEKKLESWLGIEGDKNQADLNLVLAECSRAHGKSYLRYILAQTFLSASSVVPWVWLWLALSSFLNSEKAFSPGLYGATALGVAALAFLRSWWQGVVYSRFRAETELFIRSILLQRLLRLPVYLMDHLPRGGWAEVIRGKLQQIETFVLKRLPRQLHYPLQLIVMMMVTSVVSSSLAYLFLAAVILLIPLGWFSERRRSRAIADVSSFHGVASDLFFESWQGLRTIRTHAAEPYMERRFESKQRETVQSVGYLAKKLSLRAGVFSGLVQLVGMAMALGLFAGFRTQAWGLSDLVLGFVFTPLLLKASLESGRLIAFGSQFFQDFRDLLVLVSYEERERHILERPASLRAIAIQWRDVVFENLDDWVGPLSFELRRGDLVMVTGRPGAGKSRLLEILGGLRGVHSGELKVVDASNEAVWTNPGAASRLPYGIVGYVEQYPFLFNGTVRENLVLGNPFRVTDAEIWDRVESVGLYSVVKALGGLDAMLEDQGGDLNRGERYRLCLARTLLLNRPFLALDEPFTHLDDSAIDLLSQTLRKLSRTCGVIIVSRALPESLKSTRSLNLCEHEGKTDLSFDSRFILPL